MRRLHLQYTSIKYKLSLYWFQVKEKMSLGSLARYDDAEDEIADEDHDLVLRRQQSTETPEPMHVDEAKPSPSKPAENAPTKAKTLLVANYDMSSDDDMSESDPDNDDEEPKIEVPSQNKESVVNLGLFDGSSVLPSSDTSEPASNLNDSFSESSPRVAAPANILLPPEPEGRCSKQLQEKVAAMLEKKRINGLNLSEYVERKKDFRNPSIYEKLIAFIGIDEHGTNYPQKLYNPDLWGPESHYDELARKQKEYHQQKEKEKHQKQRTNVEFVSGTKKTATTTTAPTTTSTASSAAASEKKSKWDQKVAPLSKK